MDKVRNLRNRVKENRRINECVFYILQTWIGIKDFAKKLMMWLWCYYKRVLVNPRIRTYLMMIDLLIIIYINNEWIRRSCCIG